MMNYGAPRMVKIQYCNQIHAQNGPSAYNPTCLVCPACCAPAGMSSLQDEAPVPACLTGQPLSSTNLWMCVRGSHSSLHYDPNDNLLCIVSGSKTVTLFAPGLTPCLYPRPITDESCNHSFVDHASPDFGTHPLYR